MDLRKLCGALRRGSIDAHRCLGCTYENNCSIHGCQLDMQQSIADMLTAAADNTRGVVRATLKAAVDVINGEMKL